MRRIRALRANAGTVQGITGAVLITAGIWLLAGYGWSLVAAGGFFLIGSVTSQ